MVKADFTVHPQLVADCVVVGDLPLCRVLLSRDANYPWLILVPRRADITEIYQLGQEDQAQLARESVAVSKAMADYFRADKMNIAALGNMVPQLHVHHIARFKHDAAWPKPIWGAVPAEPYSEKALEKRLQELQNLIADLSVG